VANSGACETVEEAESTASAPTKRLVGKAYRDQTTTLPQPISKDQKAAKLETAKKPQKPQSGPRSGKIVEVVLPRRRRFSSHSSAGPPTSAPPSSSEDAEDSDAPRPIRKRSASKKVSIIISDDEESQEASEFEVEQAEESEREVVSKRGKAAIKKSSAESSDYEMSAGESSSESEEENSDEESDIPVAKSKGKGKPTAKGKQNLKASRPEVSSDDNVESDVPSAKGKKTTAAAAKKNARKRKSDDEGKEEPPSKKQKKRVESDPWKLGSKDVKENWRRMQAPPLEMFHFARKVVDEYTYLQGKSHSLITKLTAERHWVLSGTPPIHDFAAIKTIAAFLNIHLGIDDDGEGQSAQVRKRRREQTGQLNSYEVVYIF
jgi:hypothetical protein